MSLTSLIFWLILPHVASVAAKILTGDMTMSYWIMCGAYGGVLGHIYKKNA